MCFQIHFQSDTNFVQNSYIIYLRSHSQLFELLAMCGMLMDFNWTEILKRRELLRLELAGFNNLDFIYSRKLNVVNDVAEKNFLALILTLSAKWEKRRLLR